MDSTALITFLFQCPAAIMTVELFGSWDNFSRPYRMEKDPRKGPCSWSGCHAFQNIICDGDPQNLTEKRDGGLKMGGTYWYYYRLDGDTEYHDPSQPSTTACPLLPGQRVNVLEVPSDGGTSSELCTLNPKDRYRNPKPAVAARPKQAPESFQLSRSQEHDARASAVPACGRSSPVAVRKGSIADASSPERSSGHKRGISLVSDSPVKVFKSALCHLKGFATPSVPGNHTRGKSIDRQEKTGKNETAINEQTRRRPQQAPMEAQAGISASERHQTVSLERACSLESSRTSSRSRGMKCPPPTATPQAKDLNTEETSKPQLNCASSRGLPTESQEAKPVTKALNAYSKALCEYTRAMTPPKAVLRNGLLLDERPPSQSGYMPTATTNTKVERVATPHLPTDVPDAPPAQSRGSVRPPSRRGKSSTGDVTTMETPGSAISGPLTSVSAGTQLLAGPASSSSLLPYLAAQTVNLHATLAQAREITISKGPRPQLLRSHFSEWSNTSDHPPSPAERPATPLNSDDVCSPVFSSLDGSSGRSSPNRLSSETQVTVTQAVTSENDLSKNFSGMGNPETSQSAASALLDLYFTSSTASELNPFDVNLGQPYITPISESPQIGIAISEGADIHPAPSPPPNSGAQQINSAGIFDSCQNYSLPQGDRTSQTTLAKASTHRTAFIMPDASNTEPLLHQPLDGPGHHISLTGELLNDFAYLGDVVS